METSLFILTPPLLAVASLSRDELLLLVTQATTRADKSWLVVEPIATQLFGSCRLAAIAKH